MAAANMLTYLQTLLDQSRFRNNPPADRLPPSMVPPGQVWTPNNAEIQQLLQALGGKLPQQLPSGLPNAVARSIQQQPSFAEGDWIPNPRIPPMQVGPGGAPLDPHEREQLNQQLWFNRQFPDMNYPLSEGNIARPDFPQPRYPSPLNQLMGRLPGMGLY